MHHTHACAHAPRHPAQSEFLRGQPAPVAVEADRGLHVVVLTASTILPLVGMARDLAVLPAPSPRPKRARRTSLPSFGDGSLAMRLRVARAARQREFAAHSGACVRACVLALAHAADLVRSCYACRLVVSHSRPPRSRRAVIVSEGMNFPYIIFIKSGECTVMRSTPPEISCAAPGARSAAHETRRKLLPGGGVVREALRRQERRRWRRRGGGGGPRDACRALNMPAALSQRRPADRAARRSIPGHGDACDGDEGHGAERDRGDVRARL